MVWAWHPIWGITLYALQLHLRLSMQSTCTVHAHMTPFHFCGINVIAACSHAPYTSYVWRESQVGVPDPNPIRSILGTWSH